MSAREKSASSNVARLRSAGQLRGGQVRAGEICAIEPCRGKIGVREVRAEQNGPRRSAWVRSAPAAWP